MKDDSFATHSYADTRQHIVHENIIDMVFSNQIANEHFRIFLFRLGFCGGRWGLGGVFKSIGFLLTSLQPLSTDDLGVCKNIRVEGGTFQARDRRSRVPKSRLRLQ